MSPVDNGYADAMPDNRIDPYADWTPAKVGCHWTRGDIMISTIHDPDQPEANYVAVKEAGNVIGYAPDFASAVKLADLVYTPPTASDLTWTRNGTKVLDDARRDRMGFLTSEEVAIVAQDDSTHLTQLLVRCNGCRFLAGAHDVQHLIAIIEKDGRDYVRDVSIPATRS